MFLNFFPNSVWGCGYKISGQNDYYIESNGQVGEKEIVLRLDRVFSFWIHIQLGLGACMAVSSVERNRIYRRDEPLFGLSVETILPPGGTGEAMHRRLP